MTVLLFRDDPPGDELVIVPPKPDLTLAARGALSYAHLCRYDYDEGTSAGDGAGDNRSSLRAPPSPDARDESKLCDATVDGGRDSSPLNEAAAETEGREAPADVAPVRVVLRGEGERCPEEWEAPTMGHSFWRVGADGHVYSD